MNKKLLKLLEEYKSLLNSQRKNRDEVYYKYLDSYKLVEINMVIEKLKTELENE